MARNRALHRIALRGVSRINLSRRLICWMDDIRMPRTALRMRYVRLVHILSLLHDTCNFVSLSDAMYTLLDEDCSGLRATCTTLNGLIKLYFP